MKCSLLALLLSVSLAYAGQETEDPQPMMVAAVCVIGAAALVGGTIYYCLRHANECSKKPRCPHCGKILPVPRPPTCPRCFDTVPPPDTNVTTYVYYPNANTDFRSEIQVSTNGLDWQCGVTVTNNAPSEWVNPEITIHTFPTQTAFASWLAANDYFFVTEIGPVAEAGFLRYVEIDN